jgi:pimeloyl-ACP methyl ester carboxylesterase
MTSFFPFKIAQPIQRDIKNSTLAGFGNAGHFLHEEQPGLFVNKSSLY